MFLSPAKSRNSFDRVTFFLYLEVSRLFFERDECLGTRSHLLAATFVCCFHSCKVVVIIVFIGTKPFRYIGILEVFLPSLASEESTCFR